MPFLSWLIFDIRGHDGTLMAPDPNGSFDNNFCAQSESKLENANFT